MTILEIRTPGSLNDVGSVLFLLHVCLARKCVYLACRRFGIGGLHVGCCWGSLTHNFHDAGLREKTRSLKRGNHIILCQLERNVQLIKRQSTTFVVKVSTLISARLNYDRVDGLGLRGGDTSGRGV
jgi:hypothetical protein